VLKNPERLTRCFYNSHDAVNGDRRVTGKVKLIKLCRSARDRVEVGVGDRHEICVAEDLQAPQLTKVGRLERFKIDQVILVCSLLRRGIDTLQLQRCERLSTACQHGAPCLCIQVSNRGPWNRERCKVRAFCERLKDKTICRSGVETMDPHAPDLVRNLGVVVADAHGSLERGEGVAVDSGAGWAVNELVQGIAFASVRELSPPLQQVSII
jgi:hypothetical protein